MRIAGTAAPARNEAARTTSRRHPAGCRHRPAERFVDFSAAYTREARFSMPMEIALGSAGEGLWQETANMSFLNFLRFINGPSVPLTNGPALVAKVAHISGAR